jgi:hypothetical protein
MKIRTESRERPLSQYLDLHFVYRTMVDDYTAHQLEELSVISTDLYTSAIVWHLSIFRKQRVITLGTVYAQRFQQHNSEVRSLLSPANPNNCGVQVW